ncbi:MAG: DUF1697 domain-containing protein [Draconibacterium sp.]
METYIAILRGVNVGGKTLKMADLRTKIERLGFENVSTYIQSGNVFFQARMEAKEVLEQKIKALILSDLNLDVSVIVLTPKKLEEIINANPYLSDSKKDRAFMHVTFLQTVPGNYNVESIQDKRMGNEEIVFTDEAVYLYCPNGYGTSKLTNNLFESKMKVAATTRNWKTTLKLLELAKNIS